MASAPLIGESPIEIVETAVYSGLETALDPSPVTGVTIRIYNGAVPDNPAYPIVLMGEVRTSPDDTKTNAAWIVSVPIWIYSNEAGKSEARTIMLAISGQFKQGITYSLSNEYYECWYVDVRRQRGPGRRDTGDAGYAGWIYYGYQELEFRVVQNLWRQ